MSEGKRAGDLFAEESSIAAVHAAVRQRQTCKLLGNPEKPWSPPAEALARLEAILEPCLADACWAPFHYDRQIDGRAEPFRFHVLPAAVCREIAARFSDWYPEARSNNKLPAMLAVCGALVIVTWLPDPALNPDAEKSVQVNEEHLAAAAAATQNLLLMLTAHGIGTYWSSGGQFREPEMFARLGIAPVERLLAAVFVECPGVPDQNVNRITGKHRDRRSAADDLIRRVEGLREG